MKTRTCNVEHDENACDNATNYENTVVEECTVAEPTAAVTIAVWGMAPSANRANEQTKIKEMSLACLTVHRLRTKTLPSEAVFPSGIVAATKMKMPQANTTAISISHAPP